MRERDDRRTGRLHQGALHRAGQNPGPLRIGEGPAVIVISRSPASPTGGELRPQGRRARPDGGAPPLFGSRVRSPRGGHRQGHGADLHLAPVLPARPRPHEPHHGVAARTGCRRARPVRRPRRRRDRYVPHRGFALAMMVDDVVVAPVLSQPSLPLPLTKAQRADLASPTPTRPVKERVAEGTCVLGLRFTGDLASRPERFERLREELGDGFISSSSTRPRQRGRPPKSAHSVLTEHLDDRPGPDTCCPRPGARLLERAPCRLIRCGTFQPIDWRSPCTWGTVDSAWDRGPAPIPCRTGPAPAPC